MKTRTMALAIALVLLMATVQTVAATTFTATGYVNYENGTTCPYGWNVEVWNLDQVYGAEPWTTTTSAIPNEFIHEADYGTSCEYLSPEDHIKVRVTSTDEKYVGENISRWGDVQRGTLQETAMDVTVYEVIPETDTFTKSLPNIGWNLISLPLAPLDNSVSAVLTSISGNYDAVKQYDATAKTFADATTMAPGTGYFVHVTTAGDWTYEGTSVSSTSPGLKTGLNMIGVPNCTKTVSAAMGSADYRYVARWNADDQKYEVYNPNAPAAFHGFTEMTAGEGYFVSAKSDEVGWTVSCP